MSVTIMTCRPSRIPNSHLQIHKGLGPKLFPAESRPHALLPRQQTLIRLVDAGKVVVGRALLHVGAVRMEDRIGMMPLGQRAVGCLDGRGVVGRHGVEA